MKNIWSIFSLDLRNIFTNWVALVVIGGLIFLPSLYAWLNIKAAWDPYGQTDQIPIAVVNEDTGATVLDKDIHVGNDLINELTTNEAMDWTFVAREKAIDQLEKGNYFAVIIIPKDFSQKLGTVISDQPKKAKMEYYVNEKINAIAPKITAKGASVLVDEISSNFISTVNGVIFDMFNDIGVKLQEDLPDIKQFENYIFTMEEKLPDIHNILNESLTDARSAQQLMTKANEKIPTVENILADGMNILDEVAQFLTTPEERLHELSPDIKKHLENAQVITSDMDTFIENTEAIVTDFSQGEQHYDSLTEQMNQSLESLFIVNESLQTLINELKEVETPNEPLIGQLEENIQHILGVTDLLTTGREHVNNLQIFLNEKKETVNETLITIKELTTTIHERVTKFTTEYIESIEPKILDELERVQKTLSNARHILDDVQHSIPTIKEVLKRTHTNLNAGEGLLVNVLGEFPYVNDKVRELAENIRRLQSEAELTEIINLLKNDPHAERSFFAEPVVLNENKIFPIENYGTGMTPFYTVLSLWVGGLLLISLLSTTVPNESLYQTKDIYFGKLATFLLAGLLQALIVTIGNITFIQVTVAHPVWFIIFGLFCSFVFITIIYTLVSIFGDVGKALAIIMLVLQIAGSGGTYPIVLLPKFFQTISPLLPFTYAVDNMREAVGGIIWYNVFVNLTVLSAFAIIAILVGALLKRPINKYTNQLMAKSKESGLFH